MIDVCGKQISESTIVEALKKYCGFEEYKKFEFNIDGWIFGGERPNRDKTMEYPYYIATVKNHNQKLTLNEIENDARIYFSEQQVKDLITNLQKMIGG